MEYVYLMILIALLEYLTFVGIVGGSRAKFGVEAPAMSGNVEWECLLRIQQNTAEQLILFIPGIYLFALLVSPLWAAVLGVVFVVGRVLYYLGYSRDPEKRGPGVVLSIVPNAVLVVGALVGLGLSVF